MATSTTRTRTRQALLGRLQEGTTDFPLLGYIMWTNCREVDLTQKQFAEKLTQAGFDKKYAREHNYRSTFIRCLHSLEERRIIRLVEDDSFRMVYQFTAETMVKKDGELRLEYDPETVIVIDKEKYRESRNIETAIIKGKKAITEVIVKLFNQEKVKYHSSDMSRYIQKIIKDQGDIIPLRQQGSIYFVPAGFSNLLNRVSDLVASIGGVSIEFAPIPDVKSSREMINNAVTQDFTGELQRLGKDIEKSMNDNSDMAPTWAQSKLRKVREVQSRIEMYADLLKEKAGDMLKDMKSIEMKIAKPRVLDIPDMVDVKPDPAPAAV